MKFETHKSSEKETLEEVMPEKSYGVLNPITKKIHGNKRVELNPKAWYFQALNLRTAVKKNK